MKNKEPIFFLQDIQNSVEKIFKYTKDINCEEFISDDMVKDAVERNFEIIGEAVKNLPDDFRNKYPHIPFKQIAKRFLDRMGKITPTVSPPSFVRTSSAMLSTVQ